MNKGRQAEGYQECDAAGMVDRYMDEVREGWRIIMKSFINLNLPTKPRRMKYAGHIACMGRMKCIQRLKGTDTFQGIGIEGSLILKYIFEKLDGMV